MTTWKTDIMPFKRSYITPFVCVCITVSLSSKLSHCTVVYWEVTEVLLAVTMTGGIEGSSHHLCRPEKPEYTSPGQTHTGHPASTDGICARGGGTLLMSNPLWVKCNHFVFHAGWIWRYLCHTWRKCYLVFCSDLNPAQKTKCRLILFNLVTWIHFEKKIDKSLSFLIFLSFIIQPFPSSPPQLYYTLTGHSTAGTNGLKWWKWLKK